MTLIEDRKGTRSNQNIYRYANDFGASVITDGYGGKGGLFELAVIKWEGDDYSLTYSTPITSDVLGYLTAEEVASTLAQIEALDPDAVVAAYKAKRIADLEEQIAAIRAE